MNTETLFAYLGIIVTICGLLASCLPQRWTVTKILTKIGALTFRATTKIPPALLLVLALGITAACSSTPPQTTATTAERVLDVSCPLVEIYGSTVLAELTGKPAEQFEALAKVCTAAKAATDVLASAGAAGQTQ